MKKLLAFLVVLGLGAGALLYDQRQVPPSIVEAPVEQTVVKAKPLPDLTLQTLEGETLRLREMEEPVVLLHFWASWCAPCVVEFPLLLDMLRHFEGRVAVVAVSLDHKAEPMERFVRSQDYEGLPIYWVHDEDFSIAYDTFLISQLPETILVGPDRMMESKIVGDYDWMSEEALAQLTALLEGSI